MFSDSRAPGPGEQKGFKPHAPHFIPWLRNSLKPHHSSDLGLNGPYKSSSDAHDNLTPLERAKGIGLFSIQGKNRPKKGELRLNGVARILPVVLRGHHILPGSEGKKREDSPAGWNQSSELHPDPSKQISPGEGPQSLTRVSISEQDNCSSHVSHLQVQSDGTGTSIRKYGPLVEPPPAMVPEEPNCKVPVVVRMEDRRGEMWDYASSTTCCQRELHSSSWLSSDNQALTQKQHGFTSNFSHIKQKSKNSQSQRDLTALREPPVERFNRPLSGIIFSTEVPQRGLSCTTTLRGPRKSGPSLECTGIHDQNQTWVQYRPTTEREPQSEQAGCSRKIVRNQIKRVVDNLEQVLRALRDVHQEMKEVVQQIDFLTLSIDLNEEEQQQSVAGGNSAKRPSDNSISGSSPSEVTGSRSHQRPSELGDNPGTAESSGILRADHNRSFSPPSVLLSTVTSRFLSDRSRNLRITPSLGSSPSQGGPLQYSKNVPSSSPPKLQNLVPHGPTLSPQRSLPVRPPTPGLSPLTINLHHPNSPSSRPHSPGLSSSVKVSPSSPVSPKPQPTPTRCPSAIIENKVRPYQTPQSDHPSVGQPCPSSSQPPSAYCPPMDSEAQTHDHRGPQASSTGPFNRLLQVCTASAATIKLPTAQGRRGRKPPPYPHNRTSEHTKKAKEPRKAPPYPEKRRLLSTTV